MSKKNLKQDVFYAPKFFFSPLVEFIIGKLIGYER